jgi:hypothetical protein
MKIIVIRVPGNGKTLPAFHILQDGKMIHEETIAGRQDVAPAMVRVVQFVKKGYNLELHPAGRDSEKRMTWTSEVPKTEAPKSETSKITPKMLAAGTKASEKAVFVNRQTDVI